jgi:hypothetical protein
MVCYPATNLWALGLVKSLICSARSVSIVKAIQQKTKGFTKKVDFVGRRGTCVGSATYTITEAESKTMSTFSSAETADEFWKCYQSQIEGLRTQLQSITPENMPDSEKLQFVSEFKQKLDQLQQC